MIKDGEFLNEGELHKSASMLTGKEAKDVEELCQKVDNGGKIVKVVLSRKGKEKVGECSMAKEVPKVEKRQEKVNPM